jgi:hypothetical protein
VATAGQLTQCRVRSQENGRQLQPHLGGDVKV